MTLTRAAHGVESSGGDDLSFTRNERQADAAPPSHAWRAEFTAWIWLMGVKGDVGARGHVADISADFGDVLDASDSLLAFSGRLELGYGPIAGFVDGMYAKIGADNQSGPAGLADIDVTFEQTIIDFGMMYRIGEWASQGDGAHSVRNTTLDLYAGARYNNIDLELDPANVEARSRARNWFDPIVGAKLVHPFSERWHARLNGDIGGFGVASDFTWSATGVLGIDFDFFNTPASFYFGYRAMGWDYTDGAGDSRFVWDVVQHGPLLGLSFRF